MIDTIYDLETFLNVNQANMFIQYFDGKYYCKAIKGDKVIETEGNDLREACSAMEGKF